MDDNTNNTEKLNAVAVKLGYVDASHLEACIESYGQPLLEWWDVIKELVINDKS